MIDKQTRDDLPQFAIRAAVLFGCRVTHVQSPEDPDPEPAEALGIRRGTNVKLLDPEPKNRRNT